MYKINVYIYKVTIVGIRAILKVILNLKQCAMHGDVNQIFYRLPSIIFELMRIIYVLCYASPY